jgi:hypothetical protein
MTATNAFIQREAASGDGVGLTVPAVRAFKTAGPLHPKQKVYTPGFRIQFLFRSPIIQIK